MEGSEHAVLSQELRWAIVVAAAVAFVFAAITYAALALHTNPPSNIELVDPKTLHLTGEFTEPNLGTRVEANGQIAVRVALSR